MATWSNILNYLGFGASRRIAGVQVIEPATGKLTNRTITPDTALQLSAVFACVRLLSETIAGLPLRFYEVHAGGALKNVEMHPLLDLLQRKTNRYQTGIEFFETLVFQLAMHGNSYHRVEKNVKGEIISLMPYMTLQTKPVLDQSGNITYEYYDGRHLVKFAEESMWHNKLFGNGVIGMSPLDYARNSIGIGISAEDRVNTMANNGFKPTGVLTIDKVLKGDQRKQIKAEFKDLQEGGEDSLRLLEAGMTYQQVSMSPKDVQLLETRRFETEDIARFFGVPSVLINDTSGSTVWGSGISQIITGFYKLGLRPYIERLESSIVNRLLPLNERRRIVPAFDFEMLLSGDEKTRYETYKTAIAGGIRTPNECRKKEGLEPEDGGDSLFMPQQMVPIDRLKKDKNNGGINNGEKITSNH